MILIYASKSFYMLTHIIFDAYILQLQNLRAGNSMKYLAHSWYTVYRKTARGLSINMTVLSYLIDDSFS